MKKFFLALFTLACAHAFEIPAQSTQCIVGTTSSWDSSHVNLRYFERNPGKPWTQVGAAWQGRLGSKGLIWGHGIHPNPRGATTKREGDSRSPAGVFTLGDAWGYAPKIKKNSRLVYHQVGTRDLWVEDPTSKFYNQHILLPHEPQTPWEKKAQMEQGDYAHVLKLFIHHNAPKSKANAGSSIFFHIWRQNGQRASSGCTTMPLEKLTQMIARLDPARQPLYILMPEPTYQEVRSAWQLP